MDSSTSHEPRKEGGCLLQATQMKTSTVSIQQTHSVNIYTEWTIAIIKLRRILRIYKVFMVHMWLVKYFGWWVPSEVWKDEQVTCFLSLWPPVVGLGTTEISWEMTFLCSIFFLKTMFTDLTFCSPHWHEQHSPNESTLSFSFMFRQNK